MLSLCDYKSNLLYWLDVVDIYLIIVLFLKETTQTRKGVHKHDKPIHWINTCMTYKCTNAYSSCIKMTFL